jgi:hypothetical protein
MKHTHETSGRTAPVHGGTIMDQTRPTEGQSIQRAGSRHETNKALEWFSSLQERMRSKSSPFYLFGLGLAAGGLSLVWAKRRHRRSLLMRDFSGVAKEIRHEEKDAGPLQDVGL